MNRLGRKEWLVLILLVAVVAVQVWATYQYLTLPYTGGNDFYSRWAGARALLVEGRDPYSLEVTTEIQAVKGIDPSLQGKGSFAYPLHVIYLFWPLVYLSYPLALAFWMTLLIWLTVAAVILALRLYEWRPSPLGLTGLLISAILLYPVARSIILGQFTIHVAFFLTTSLLFLRRGRDGWAGAMLAAASVKGQMLVLTAPWLVVWAIAGRRWRFLAGLLGTGALLFLAALALFPGWPGAFLADVQRYASVAGGKNPLVVLGDQMAPGAGELVRVGLAAALLLATIYFCWRGLKDQAHQFQLATYWTIVAGLLIFFQTGTTNQVLLLLPLIDWLSRLVHRPGGRLLAVAIMLVLVSLPWILFSNTVDGNAESAVMFLPLPVLALVTLTVDSTRSRSHTI